MSEVVERLSSFATYAQGLGDEKGEAQVFCDRLFRAFGHAGYKEAGATLEARIPKKGSKGKKYIDLLWKPRVLIEMKSAAENLSLHYQQAFDYWLAAVPNRPRYVVLCNFKEFWIYDFDRQLDQPVDCINLADLPLRYTALNFLFPDNPKPYFKNDLEPVSREAADRMAALFRNLVRRPGHPIPREQAQRFVLQLLVSMFAEDLDLLPAVTIKRIVDDCFHNKQSSYDLFGALFKQMDNPKPATAGRFKGVRYFNGGLFSTVDPIELTKYELELIGDDDSGAALKNWSKVNPAIFGTLFQDSMEKVERHAFGAHYTAEADILRIVGPTIIRPWTELIDTASSMKQLLDLRARLAKFTVLDPACGSGNFLYVCYRELSRLDLRILERIRGLVSAAEFAKQVKTLSVLSPKQFYGIEYDTFGLELAKVTLMLAKKLAIDEAKRAFGTTQGELALQEEGLPLDNLDANFTPGDALLLQWPAVDAVIGNPPYQSKNKRQGEMEPGYELTLRKHFPDVDGRADYCTYWFRKAHDVLQPGSRAGLVGTNTIRQNYSREASLDYILDHDGTITEAVSSMVWPGEAVVHVSIVNWMRGQAPGPKQLFFQDGNKAGMGERKVVVDYIGPALSTGEDVTKAKALRANKRAPCFQGQTHGHAAFLLKAEDARSLISHDKSGEISEVLFPFLIANEVVGLKTPKPRRYVIDFAGRGLMDAEHFPKLLERIKSKALPARQAAAQKEEERNKAVLKTNPDAKTNVHHARFLEHWWQLSYARENLIAHISKLSRYIVCGQVTKRPIFTFVRSSVRPNAALQVFGYEDDYTFGILQSSPHWEWFTSRCSTMKSDPRYTSNTVWDSFPWPQKPSVIAIKAVADAAVSFRTVRDQLAKKHNRSYRDLYRTLEMPGDNPLKTAQGSLDEAVKRAYGFSSNADIRLALLTLNLELSELEKSGIAIRSGGVPEYAGKDTFITEDAIDA